MRPSTTLSKWDEKRKRLMENHTYATIIRRAEGDAEMFHRITLAIVEKRKHTGEKYSPLRIK